MLLKSVDNFYQVKLAQKVAGFRMEGHPDMHFLWVYKQEVQQSMAQMASGGGSPSKISFPSKIESCHHGTCYSVLPITGNDLLG